MLDAGVVDQNVDAAKVPLGVSEQVFDLFHITKIGRVMTDPGTVAGDLGDGRTGVAEAVEDQVGAGLGQHMGNTQADAAGGAGNHCCFTFELHE
ncbi:hypothetical protein D3C77_300590 [compost metagenome]